MEEYEDFSCPESFDDDVTISGPASRYCVSLLHDDEDSSSGDEHLYYAPSSPMKRATLHPQHLGAAKSSLGRRSRSEDQLPRISIDAVPQSSFTSAPSPSGQQQWDDALREISGEIPPDHIRNKLRSNSFSRDDATLCLGQTSSSAAFERDKENHSNFRNGGSGLGLPGDGSSAGTMITVGIPRHHSSLRVATDRAHNSPIASRRAKSVPVRPTLPELRLEGSASSLSSSSGEAAPSPMRVSSAPSISFSATATATTSGSGSGSLPLNKRLTPKSTLHCSLNLSPRVSRRSDASAFHSPARQGSKSRGCRAFRSLLPLTGQPSPARPSSTPPIMPFALNEPLDSMAPFSKSEPLLPSADHASFGPMELASPNKTSVCSPTPVPQSPFQALRIRSVSLSNLHAAWSMELNQTGTFPVGPRRGGRGQLAPPDHQSEGAEAGEDEDEQPSKRKRGISKSPARMAFSCSSLSDITEWYQKPVLPIVSDSSLLDAISAETVMKVLAGQYSSFFTEVIIVDCRYPYEYEGGHIEGAINLPLLESIEERFPVDRDLPDRDKTIIIFHCEFSSKRGPAGIRHLRGLDREANIDRHPKTCYPHVYLLRGGYKEFFEKGKSEHCTPPQYRTMQDPEYKTELQKWNTLVKKRSWKKQKSQSISCFSTITGRPV